jgi:ATP-dependent Clp endopeptidase proteolytic subunit ClpP
VSAVRCQRGQRERLASLLPNSSILIHQVSGGFQGPGTDIEIQAREVIGLEEIYSEHTGKPIEELSRDMERDFFMSADALHARSSTTQFLLQIGLM